MEPRICPVSFESKRADEKILRNESLNTYAMAFTLNPS